MFEVLFYILILLAGFPTGLVLERLCIEEIKNWRTRFLGVSIICFILTLVVSFTNLTYKLPYIISLWFMTITSLTLVWKGYKLGY